MRDCDRAHDIVSRQGWLSNMPPSFRRQVLERCRPRHFTRGQSIHAIGEPPGCVYGLVAGGVAISIAPNEDGPFVAFSEKPGAWFGLAAAITGRPRPIGIEATCETDVLRLSLHAMNDIASGGPTAWRLFAIGALDQLDVVFGTCADLMIRDPFKRCVGVLLSLAGCRVPRPPDSPPIDIHLSQEDLAALSNVARTTMNTALHKLERSGKLERSYRRIRVLAPSAMRAMLRD
jgi:CRP/FNR family transcriptional regulator, cyclic AMP receptor protein